MIPAIKDQATLVNPYRGYLRPRPWTRPVQRLLAEIREQGYTGRMNLLYRYFTQGRVQAGRPHLPPKSAT